MDTIDFMQQVALMASELQAAVPKSQVREWKLGYKMLFNPKLHCPFCDGWIESKRVWMVDEANYTVKRVWKLDGTKVNVDGCHPHVGAGGKICMGSACTASDALIAGIGGGDDFVRAWDWFPQQLGHSCPTMEEARSVGRFNRHQDDPFEEEHEGEIFCESCDEWYHEDDVYYCREMEIHYCNDCWSETHEPCGNCGSDIHIHLDESSIYVEGRYGEQYVCEECYSEKYFTCEKCDEAMLNEKYEGEGICKDCWAEDHSKCDRCGEWCENSDVDVDNHCSACAADFAAEQEEEEASDGE